MDEGATSLRVIVKREVPKVLQSALKCAKVEEFYRFVCEEKHDLDLKNPIQLSNLGCLLENYYGWSETTQ
jgi:hypothetical protein